RGYDGRIGIQRREHTTRSRSQESTGNQNPRHHWRDRRRGVVVSVSCRRSPWSLVRHRGAWRGDELGALASFLHVARQERKDLGLGGNVVGHHLRELAFSEVDARM